MMQEEKNNDGLKEVGKSLLTLANLFLIIFFINNYLQKDDYSIIGIILSLYTVIMLYFTGYTAINKGDRNA